MNNEEKILQILTQMQGDISGLKTDVSGLKQGQDRLEQGQDELKQDVTSLKQGQAELKQGQTRLEQKVTKIEVVIENEIKPGIQTVAEGHKGLVDKLDGLPEKIVALQDDTTVHRAAIHELARRTANK